MSKRARFQGISLGLFAGDLTDLAAEAAAAADWGAQILHFDVMDGVFVPQFTGGAGFVKGLGGDALLDIHLMVARPVDHVAAMIAAGADLITVHAEAEGADAALYEIRREAKKAGREVLTGIALMPGTSLAEAAPLLAQEPDLALVLALDPRDNTPPDIKAACARVADLRALLPDALIAFDGGVTDATLSEIMAAGPDIVVSGSAVMRAPDRKAAFQAMAAAF
ncbi:MAG: ribulose phosphate epimerase [Pseudomonadota bacterium]